MYDERMKTMAREDIAYVQDVYGHALWYAWGCIDAMQMYGVKTGDLFDINDGFRFAESVGDAAIKFRTGETFFMGSVLSLWADFKKAKQGVVTITVLP